MRRSKEHSEACERQIIAQLGTGPQVNLLDDFSWNTLHILLYIAYVYIYIVRSIYTYNVMCLYYVVLCVYVFTCTYRSRKWEIKCRNQPTVCPLKHKPRNPVPSGTADLGDSTNCLS